MDFFEELETVRERWNVLRHPFYQRWSAGELTIDELAVYSGQYRAAVVALADASEATAAAAEDPKLAERAEGLRDRLRGTVGEVRRIVDGLRPAALDELGLAGALQALATDDAAITVTVRTVVPPDLPAAVEVAAYRIASEAVSNAIRHSGAQSVTLTVDGALTVTITDDGSGFGADATAGVGLQSLHDRAAEVGGTLTVTSTAEGTTVRAELPT